MRRLAIYFTPSPDTALAREASRWLGRDIYHSGSAQIPDLTRMSRERMAALLKPPRHYGFHATIKPPFKIGEDVEIASVQERLADFCRKQTRFILPPLQLMTMDHFFCLRLGKPFSALMQLAAEAVSTFDDLRLLPTEEELARRRAGGLTDRQEKMLHRWGYPYVMKDFRFHLTLTGKVTDEGEQRIIEKELHRRFCGEMLEEISFAQLSLFLENDGAPLACLSHHAFS